MLINCYYYAPHNHTLLYDHLSADMERIASLGTDVVSFCVQEGQMTNWHQQRIRNVISCIHAHGMKAHAVPNRWAGLVAGWLDGFGSFTLENRDTLIQSEEGGGVAATEMVSCINHPKVAEHIRRSISSLLENFEFDGFIWDEPHPKKCNCRYCQRLDSIEPNWVNICFARFLNDMSAHAKSIDPDLVVSVFIQPGQENLIPPLLEQEHLDYVGSDGHVRSPSHEMHRMKGTIFEVHQAIYPMIQEAGRKSMFLLEAQRHRDEDLANYLENVDCAFDLPMDQLMWYYSAHEMSPENEPAFNRATWSAVKRAAGRSS